MFNHLLADYIHRPIQAFIAWDATPGDNPALELKKNNKKKKPFESIIANNDLDPNG